MFSVLMTGTLTAMKLFGLSIVLSLPLALIVALGRMSKHKWISWPVRAYLLLMRGTPLMLQLMVVYFGPYYVFGSNPWSDRFAAALFAYVINYAAYFAEIYRGGIESIDRGQYEAGKVLGMSRAQTFFRIILPQVVKRILPACGNEFMTLVKDTALAMTIAVDELMRRAQNLAAASFNVMPLLVAGLFYLIINTVLEQGFGMAEKKLSYYK